MLRRFLGLCVIGLWLLAGCRAAQTERAANTPELIASSEPERPLAADFQLTNLEGELVSLEEYRGKVVLLNFWASWCPSCRSEMASLELYHQAHQAENLVVLGINYQEDAEVIASFVTGAELSFPVLLDPEGKIAASYGVVGLPTSFFIDCDGQLIGFWPGAVSASLLEQQLTPYLEECLAKE